MANVFFDAVRFVATSTGTGDFVVNSAVQGFRTPAQASIPNGAAMSYRAETGNLGEWEEGQTVYTVSGTSLSRNVTSNHLGTTAKVNFTSVPQVAIVLASSDIVDAGKFTSGTVPAARLPAATTSAQGAVNLATNSDVAAASSSTLAVTPSTLVSHTGVAKSWVNFFGVGSVTVRASVNVSSVVRNGTGDYTVNFTNAYVDVNFAAFVSIGDQGSVVGNRSISISNLSASACRIMNTVSNTSAAFDGNEVCMAAFR